MKASFDWATQDDIIEFKIGQTIKYDPAKKTPKTIYIENTL